MTKNKAYIEEEMNEKQAKKNGYVYAFIFLLFLIFSLFMIYQFNHYTNIENLAEEQYEELAHIEETVHDYLKSTISTILMFNNSKHARILLQADDEIRWDLFSDIFLSVISQSSIYNQVRLIDTQGQEIVRVDRQIDGTYEIISKEDLQYKGDRYYFKETISIPENQIYISPFDLNVEHGEVEIPYKPMIRIGKPIFDNNGNKLGIIIINVMGQQLLEDIETHNIHIPDKLYLLDSEGYYLLHDDQSKTFSFMFDDMDSSFHKDQPEAWNQILKGDQFIEGRDGNYYVHRTKLVEDDQYKTNERYFYLVMFVPKSEINRLDEDLLNSIYFSFAIVAPFMIVVGWMLGSQRSKNKWYRKKLEENAARDGLTGLYNHRMIVSLLTQSIGLARRRDEELAVVFIDINNLKYVNDNYGHDAGDKMIIAAADSLNSSVRSTDLVSRLGGDEFLVVLPDCDAANAHAIMKRCRTLYKESGIKEMNMPWIMSYGCVTLENGESTEDVIRRADALMYQFKRASKNETSE